MLSNPRMGLPKCALQCGAVLCFGEVGVAGFHLSGQVLVEGVLGHLFRQTVLVDAEGERREVLVADVHGADLADVVVLTALADDKHCLGLVVELGADVTTHVVVAFVEMEHAVDVEVMDT